MSKCGDCHIVDGSGCCSDEIFVTLRDALKISKAKGIPVDELVEFRSVSPELKAYNEDNDFSKLWRDEKLLMISRHNNPDLDEEDCRFTSKQGCTIFEDRPKICRVFPFWFKRDKNNRFEIYLDKDDDPKDEFCRICKTNDSGATDNALKDCGESSREKFIEFCKTFETDMVEYNTYADDLAKGIKPSEIIKQRNIQLE